MKIWKVRFLLLTSFCFFLTVRSIEAQSAPVVYQGRLSIAGAPANGPYDMQFKLFDTAVVSTGAQQGDTVAVPVPVTNGIFTVTLDFGAAAFTGAERFLEIGVKPAGTISAYNILAPRQQITSVPYAIHSLSATQLDGRPASSFIQADSNGNVGIGSVPSPADIRLNVTGNTRITTGGSGGYIQVGTPGGETGLSALGKNRFDLRFDDNTLTLAAGPGLGPPWAYNGMTMNTNGNVAVGMENPLPASQWKFQINGPFRITPSFDESAVEFSKPNGETGISILDSFDRADVRFNGSTLKLVAGFGPGAPPEKNGLAITTSGKVGIGTTSPDGKLHVVDSVPSENAIYGRSFGAKGRGVRGDGDGTGSIGVYGVAKADSSVGVFGSAANKTSVGVWATNPNGTAIYADGNAAQPADKGGFVKAMAYINGSGTVIRCYNPQNATDEASTAPCGINCFIQNGQYVIQFGFPVKDRFVMVTPDTFQLNVIYHKNAGITYGPSDDSITVSIWATGDNKAALDEFTIFVF